MSAELHKRIGLGDVYGTRVEIDVDTDDLEPGDAGAVFLELAVGQSGGRGYATPEVARQIAAGLLDAADLVESATSDRSTGS